MSNHDHSKSDSQTTGSFWKSRAGFVLIIFLIIIAILLVYEHRVHIFAGNGVLLLSLALCVGMHFFMHGGHGGHGKHGGGKDGPDQGGRP